MCEQVEFWAGSHWVLAEAVLVGQVIGDNLDQRDLGRSRSGLWEKEKESKFQGFKKQSNLNG